MASVAGFFSCVYSAITYRFRCIHRVRNGNIVRNLYIPRDALVLDVGAGHNPCIRADVLLEKYVEDTSQHRCGRTVRPCGLPLVIGDALEMPFLDGVFDYAICRHVLEHVSKPAVLAEECNRVSKRGYMEAPSPLIEIIHGGFPDEKRLLEALDLQSLFHGWGMKNAHQWYVLAAADRIYVLPKTEELLPLYLMIGFFAKKIVGREVKSFFRRPVAWHTQAEWSEGKPLEIRMLGDSPTIEGDERYSCDEIEQLIASIERISKLPPAGDLASRVKIGIRDSVYGVAREIALESILACPVCKRPLEHRSKWLLCRTCGRYPMVNGVPVLLREAVEL
jgi:SAM-dependent methyltransferase